MAPGTDNACGVSAALSWYALSVRPNHENSVAVRLGRLGLEQFFPTYLSRVVWSDRVRRAPRPLFPGYVFLHGGAEGLAIAAGLGSVVSALPSNLAPLAIPDEDIDVIKALLASGLPVEPHTPTLGERVTITRGPLAGIAGVVVRVYRATRLVVNIETLHGRAIAVELDPVSLRSAEDAEATRAHKRC